MAEALLTDLDEAGEVDWDLWNIDGTVIRASHAAAGARHDAVEKKVGEPPDHALGKSRGGFGTKIHLIADGRGVPLIAELMPGQQHESTRCEPLVQALLSNRPGVLPKWLAGDKGYTARRIREWLMARKIEPVIARQKAERVPGDENDFDRQTYRRRNVVERCIGWLKECRAMATRFEKLAVNFLGTVRLAMIQRYLRLLDSSDRA